MLTTQVPVEAFVAHENEPDGAAEHATRDGLAPEPAAAQLVVVAKSGRVTVPVNVGEARGALAARSVVKFVTPDSGNPVPFVSVTLVGVPRAMFGRVVQGVTPPFASPQATLLVVKEPVPV